MGQYLSRLGSQDGRHGSPEGTFVTSGRSRVLVGVGVAAGEAQEREEVDISALCFA